MLAFRPSVARLERAFMDTIVFLITLSAGALAVHYKERLRYFVPKRQAGARVLVDQSLGLARLELPDGWRQLEGCEQNRKVGEGSVICGVARLGPSGDGRVTPVPPAPRSMAALSARRPLM